MQVLLSKHIHLLLKILFISLLMYSCSSESKKPKTAIKETVVHIQKENLKKEVKKPTLQEIKDSLLAQIPKKELLIKDIINHKNVKSFFLDYGKKNPETKLLLKTRLGNIHITLYKETPLHRASFIYLIKNGYYNKTCFHRIVKDFIIQGGWSEKTIVDTYRIQLNNYKLPPEFRDGITHKRGALSATRRWVNNPGKKSNPFEFFIIQTKLDCSHLDGEHTVFGQVTKGLDVIDKIIDVKLDGHSEWPEVDVNIEFEILG
ncbi:peptidylprolyl isomerase [Wenyingzhuangia heitensis]|uniref:Peptidyl-prolyl cis-trans isomerase n=1 Tax=Wenyingzhuangia heitensis TaxID=1487859 RepID=A0ABX0UCW6_9FLAO|nr:peptidylprolyl isomerase [Wenyingzhuangia heitensis]NIJ45311.1 peptidylprolyl isomerase [Wenyingzhuangia heitensis]